MKTNHKDLTVINTGLESFRLIDSVTEIDDELIRGAITFCDAPPFLAVETLAQICAYHKRYLDDFQIHSFLLKIKNCSGPFEGKLNGEYKIESTLKAKSDRASTHTASLSINGKIIFESQIIIASTEYSDHFPREKFEKYYRDVFTCLMKNGKKN